MLIANEDEFHTVLRTIRRVFILFYAPWCGFSRRFLPVYEKYQPGHEPFSHHAKNLSFFTR